MKKNRPRGEVVRHALTVIKYSVYCCVLVCVTCSGLRAHDSFSQILDKRISIAFRNVGLSQALDELSSKTQVNFIYTTGQKMKAVSNFEAENEKLGVVLTRLLKPYKLIYVLVGNSIIIKNAGNESAGAPVVSNKPTTFESIRIRGRILDQKEPPGPLPGVTVGIKGSSKGTVTDVDGFFELDANVGDVLVLSQVGMAAKEYAITGKEKNLIISLAENASTLSEVVVTGFSEQKAKYVASSVSMANMTGLTNKPITQLSQALQGGATGINVSQGSGLPGGDAAAIKIRGIGSLTGSDPLVLVDGVPFDLNKLDPNTIESISILKDAAAASVYGARAGNGVILVTTKRGVAGKVDVQYNGFYGIQTPMYIPKFVEGATYMGMINEAQNNIGGAAIYTQEAIEATRAGSDPIRYPSTNWAELMIKKQSPIQQHALNVSGGNAAARFALSVNFLKQAGSVALSGFSRGTVRANTSVDLSRNFVVFMDLFAARDDQREPYANNRLTADLMGWIYTAPPNIASKYPDKPERLGYTYYGTYGESWNPLAQVEKGGFTQSVRDEVLINLRPKWDVTPGLTLKGQFSYRVQAGVDKSDREAYTFFDYFTNKQVGLAYGTTKGTTKAFSTNERLSYYYVGGNADYNKNFGNHRLNLIGGFSRELTNSGVFTERGLVSFFGKAYYSYNDKYLLEVGVRQDGSSLFAPGKKWGFFPSVAVGWNVKNERFLKDINVLNQFKLRGSYGTLGNMGISPYLFQTTISASSGTESSIGNPNITWEKVAILDVGADLSFFNRQVDITADWYEKKTRDLILSPQPTLTSGLRTAPVNIGNLVNRGFEFRVGYNRALAKDVDLSVNVGYSYNKTKWLKLSQELPLISANQIRYVGGAVTESYGYKSLGLLQQSDMDQNVPILSGQQPGDVRYQDIDGNGVINANDRVSLGRTDPQLTYFSNLTLRVKNFDVETQLTGIGRVPIFYTERIAVPLNTAGEGGTPTKWHLDYWTPQNTKARFPRLLPAPGNNLLFSDYWKVNGAFARVRYIQLGYTLPTAVSNRLKIRSLRVYLNAQNPFTFTQVEMVDPETRGTHKTYPMFKTYTAGLNIRF